MISRGDEGTRTLKLFSYHEGTDYRWTDSGLYDQQRSARPSLITQFGSAA